MVIVKTEAFVHVKISYKLASEQKKAYAWDIISVHLERCGLCIWDHEIWRSVMTTKDLITFKRRLHLLGEFSTGLMLLCVISLSENT